MNVFGNRLTKPIEAPSDTVRSRLIGKEAASHLFTTHTARRPLPL
jgi:hypothetical protein